MQCVAGRDVWVSDTGAGEPSRLMVHCSLADQRAWRPLVQALPPARNIAFDLPGHGRSADWDGTAYQSDSVAIAAALLDQPAHVIGHSFGATVVLRLAIERPDLVQRLTLIEPVFFAAARGTPEHAAHTLAFAPFVTAWNQGDRITAARIFIDIWGLGVPWDDLAPRQQTDLASRIHLIPATAPAIEDDAHGMIPRFGEMTCPVDLIEGAQSPAVIGAIMARLQQGIPQAVRHRIDGAGHMVPLTHAAQVALALEGS